MLGLVLQGKEAGCDAVIFTRDRDGYKDREASIERAIQKAQEENGHLKIVGGLAVEEIESWIRALRGERGSEKRTDPKRDLEDPDREAFVDTINTTDFNKIPEDASSLHLWLERARKALAHSG